MLLEVEDKKIEQLEKEVKGVQETISLLTIKGGMVDKVDQIYDYLLGDGVFEKTGAKKKLDIIWKEYETYSKMKPVIKELVEERRALRVWKRYGLEINFVMSTITLAFAVYLTIQSLVK